MKSQKQLSVPRKKTATCLLLMERCKIMTANDIVEVENDAALKVKNYVS